ncbi:MAG: hypothetical protein AMXMBFR64_18650 [Myxococcales bacterium]
MRNSLLSTVARSLSLAALLSLAVGACRSEAPAPAEPERRPSEVGTVAAAGSEGVPLDHAPGELAAEPANEDPPALAQEGDEEEEEEDRNFWKGVRFDRENFDEVRRFVREHYIDDHPKDGRAYAEACNYAMLSLHQPHQLLPVAFYEARKDDPDEEGRLGGKTLKPYKDLPIVAAELVEKKEKEKRKRLSDDEIRDLRDKLRKRTELLEGEWSKIDYKPEHFDLCMEKARELGKTQLKKEAKKDKEAADRLTSLDRDLWIAAANGYLSSLDPHSSVVSSKAWDQSTKRTTDNSFEGIGAILTQRNDETIVESPIEGQPAHAAGVRAGDVIVKVDGKSIDGLQLPQVVKRIRGPKATVVTLTLRRMGEPEDIEIPITRSFIEIKNVSANMIKHHKDIGYVKLTGFVPTSTSELQRAIDKLQKEAAGSKLRGLVFDLRGNSGGLLNQAVSISELFLPSGSKIVSVKDRTKRDTGKEKLYRSSATETYSMPLVVLTNDSSASASEIVASALQDNRRALVLGDRSFGKASVQTLFNPDIGRGYYIKLTVARYYAPSGRTIQVTGVSPDVEVAPDIDKPMPLGFREENLSNHLSAIPTPYTSENAEMMGMLDECVKKRGNAEQIHQADPNPQLRFDYQLLKAADYIECLADAQAQAKATPTGGTDVQ